MTDSKKEPVAVFILKRLGAQAPEFDLPVDIQKLDGTPARLVLRCKALRKTEWAAIKDARQRELIESTLDTKVAAEADAVAASDKAPKRGRKKAADATDDTPKDANALREVVLRTFDENSLVGAVNDALKADAALVLKFAIGWELEDEFNEQNLGALEDEFAGAMETAINAYDRAVFRGQVGNSKP